jgi:IS30 family transposase
MLRYMEQSTIYHLKQKGWTNVQIAEFTGHHRDTIARVLRERRSLRWCAECHEIE